MSEDFTLKKVLNDVNCHLEVMMKKCELLAEQNKKYYQLAKEYEIFKANSQELQLMNNELMTNLQNLEQNYKYLEDLSEKNISSLEQKLNETERQLISCRENNNDLKKQLNDIEVELSVTKIQSETFKNDFELERESREKLNDEKLRLEEALEEIKSKNTFHFNEERGQAMAVADGRNTVRCPVCRDP